MNFYQFYLNFFQFKEQTPIVNCQLAEQEELFIIPIIETPAAEVVVSSQLKEFVLETYNMTKEYGNEGFVIQCCPPSSKQNINANFEYSGLHLAKFEVETWKQNARADKDSQLEYVNIITDYLLNSIDANLLISSRFKNESVLIICMV